MLYSAKLNKKTTKADQLTQVAMEKNEKATVARPASKGMLWS